MSAMPPPLLKRTDPRPARPSPQYQRIAQALAHLIHGGVFKPGQRLPSVRESAAAQGVSVSTALQAYRQLEELGLVQARPKAGYFVRRTVRIAQPKPSSPPQQSLLVERYKDAQLLTQRHQEGALANFGGFTPKSNDLFDDRRLRVAIARASRVHRRSLTEYNKSDAGRPALREAVARRAIHMGCILDANNIVVTASCTQAVYLCLKAVTKAGDVVALESPTFFGYLDLVESLGLRVLEIPTHPRTGLSLPALELALETQPVKIVLTSPTLSNPLGSTMPTLAKRQLVQMLARRGVPLIEDVVFNDFLVGEERRKAAKSFDAHGGVMICGSFAKTLAPGIRLGWVEGGRWSNAVAIQKQLQGAATNVVLEEALADLLTQGNYEAHLRRLVSQITVRRSEARYLISQHFPPGTRVSNPPSGYTIWVEMPSALDGTLLLQRCTAEGITFRTGSMFTATDRYRHCLRLSLSGLWDEKAKTSLARIGAIAREILVQSTAASQVPRLLRA